ncbi:MAG TPA: hypothetical protein VN688_20850 [Gemmataceae bacterium]|nr:hypothetical protein [Gemmataceae bacterium]
MSERSEDLELTGLESALRGLQPQVETLDRAVLMYRAGRASARGWGWPLATLGATTLAIVLGILPLIRPAPVVVERIVYLPAPQPQPPAPTPEESVTPSTPDSIVVEPLDASPRSRYLRMQEQVLRWGLDGLPMPPPAAPTEEPPTVEQLLQSL